jgi:mannose-1-phosphate guanylyltransferase
MNSSLEDRLWGVILAGGIGSRFWPASTPRRPKQLLHLASDQPLILDTFERIEPLIPTERLRVLTGPQLAVPIESAVPQLGPGHFFLEPRAAGTAPVLVWAAVQIERAEPDAIMVSLHADHIIQPPETFRNQIAAAARLAEKHQRLFTLGAIPNRAETGYGYVHLGAPLGEGGPGAGYEVDRFVEKPDSETAERYVAAGDYLWNTGLFVWRVRDLIDEIERHTPEIASLLHLLREDRTEEFFERVPNLSIDEGLLERSSRVGVLPTEFEWDDIGAWDALFRTHEVDAFGNVVIGEGYTLDTRNTALHSDDGPIVAFGVEDLVIVRTEGVTFVAHRGKVGELKRLLGELPESVRVLE